MVTIAVIVRTARRLGGTGAAIATTVVLLASFPLLTYWLVITKTYALTACCISCACAALTTARTSRALTLAALSAVAAAASRLSAVGFAVVVVAYCLRAAPSRRSRVVIVASTASLAVPIGALLALDPAAARWNLFDYHHLAGSASLALTAGRVFAYARAWPLCALLLIAAVACLALDADLRGWLRASHGLVAISLGALSFLVLNTLGGQFFANEYAVPALPVLVMASIVVISRSELITRLGVVHRAVGVTLLAIVLLAAGATSGFLGRPGWLGAPSAADSIVRCVAAHSRSDDRVLALSMSEVVPAARRLPITRASLGPFSYEDVSDATARRFHILNRRALTALIANREPAVVVLSSIDTQILGYRGYFSARPAPPDRFFTVLAHGYRPVCHGTVVFQTSNIVTSVTAYVRTEQPKA